MFGEWNVEDWKVIPNEAIFESVLRVKKIEFSMIQMPPVE